MNIAAGFLTPAFGRTWQTSCLQWQKPAVTMRPESAKVLSTSHETIRILRLQDCMTCFKNCSARDVKQEKSAPNNL